MAASQKLYPRATVKKIVKAHSKKAISKNADVLVSFDILEVVSVALLTIYPDLLGLRALPADVRIPAPSFLIVKRSHAK